MTDKSAPEEKFQDLNLLSQAFGSFNQAATTLSGFYKRLTEEINGLDLELAQKNQALSESLAEQERTKNFLTCLLDSLTVGVVVLDPEGRVTLANNLAAELLGPSPGRPLEDALGPRLKDVCLRPAGPSGSETDGARQYVAFPGPDGRLLAASLSPFPWPEEDHCRPGLLALVEDVTDPARIGAQRERSRSLSAMGEMAAEITHQIRNPLGGIELFASILGREVQEDEYQTELVEQILSGVKQVNHLLTNYLTLARLPRPVTKPVKVDDVIHEALAAAAHALERAGVEIRVARGPRDLTIDVDPELMLQVFLSIILNAVEALMPGGRLEIRSRAVRGRAVITFLDTGRGIPNEDLDRVFNPFFTTKVKSLGLGLTVSHRIMDAHKGQIQVGSQPGRGTTVTLTLPIFTLNEGPAYQA